MGAHSVRGPMPDRPDVQINALQGAERPFDTREVLVGLNRFCGGHMIGRHAGSDYIDAVEAGLGFDLIEPPLPGEMTVADRDDEVLGHLSFVENRTDRQANLGGVMQAGALATDLDVDPGQIALGRRQQVLTLARPLSGKVVIAAHNQPFAREQVRRADFSEIAVIEQRQLQRPVLGSQRLHRRGTQVGDPIEICGPEVVANARRGDHAAIADDDHAADAEAILQLLDLHAQGRGVRGVAVEHFHGDRQPLARAEHAIDDLWSVLAVIPAVAITRQRAATALEVRRTDVVEHQHAVFEMAPRQAILDARLTLE